MAKVITENFRIENTNELFTSFKNLNTSLGENFTTLLGSYNTSASLGLGADNTTAIRGFVDDQLNALRPEANYYIMASSIDKTAGIVNTQKEKRDFQRRAVFGNKVDVADVRYMFYENSWTTGTIYDDYDDEQDIAVANSIVTVKDDQGNYYIYKCLDNNNGIASTVQPTFSNIDLTTYISITSSDGYVWKYLFTVSDSDALVYKTVDSLPLPYPAYGNTDVISSAKEEISQIIVEQTPSAQFNQFLFGQATGVENGSDVTLVSEVARTDGRFRDVVISITPKTGRILAQASNAYKGMYLRSSSGKLYDVLTSSTPSADTISVALETTDTIQGAGATGKQCQLVIKIKVSNSDLSGTPCLAYGIIDALGTLSKVAFAERGSNYKFASAEVIYPEIITVPGLTTLRAVVSPTGGHGFNPISEMAMSRLAILTDFNGESTTVPDSNYYTKVGLIKNPTFINSSTPTSFDNRASLTFVGLSKATSYPVNHFVTQHIQSVDIRDLQDSEEYIITDLGVNSADGVLPTTLAMTLADWTSLGWTTGYSGDSVPSLGSKFTSSGTSAWKASNVTKRGKVSKAISTLTGAPGEETVVARIHESLLGGGTLNSVAISDTSGQFTCAAATLKVGDRVLVDGTFTGTGSITGHTSGTRYLVSAVTGTSPSVTGFTVTATGGGAIVTGEGNTVGATFTSESDTVVSLVDYKGSFKSKLQIGPIQIRSTLTAANVSTDSINTTDTITYGSYNEFSGELLHFMDFDPIERTATRKEKIKFIFDF